MTADRAALVERMAEAMRVKARDDLLQKAPATWDELASAALDIALEEAARVASDMWIDGHGNLPVEPYAAAKQVCSEIAAAIRATKSKP